MMEEKKGEGVPFEDEGRAIRSNLSEAERISATIPHAPTHKPYRAAFEGNGALVKWRVYGPIKEVGRGYFMRRQDAEAHAEELNAVHAYAIKISREIIQPTNR